MAIFVSGCSKGLVSTSQSEKSVFVCCLRDCKFALCLCMACHIGRNRFGKVLVLLAHKDTCVHDVCCSMSYILIVVVAVCLS